MNTQSNEARRTRKEYGQRASRTYYAVSEKGDTLYRFTNHTNREEAIETEGLRPLGALEFRNLCAADVDGKLRVVEQKRSGRLAVIAEPRKRGPGRPPKVTLGAAVVTPGRRPRKVIAASAVGQPVKRGRGRPRKVATELTASPVISAGTHIKLTQADAKELGMSIARELVPQLSAMLNIGNAGATSVQPAGATNQGQ